MTHAQNRVEAFADASKDANFPISIAAHQSALARQKTAIARVGHRLLRRLRYVVLLVFWTVCHRSVSNARWVLDYEGIKWD